MKLAPLLAEFLYSTKRLDLPGIGTFHLDPSAIIEQENSKHNKPVEVTGISFENNPSIKESPELIGFISSRTGKMKALASSDLESHLELVQQFLNIGKPFLLEGIGSLVKVRSGQYEFISGGVMSEKIKEFSAKEISATSSTEESFTDYQNIFAPKTIKTKWKRPLIILALLVGVVVAIWGGYKMYKKRASKEEIATAPEKKPEEITLVKDTTQIIPKKDSNVTQVPTVSTVHTGSYKFVVETATKERGLQRFGTLKNYGLNIQMETADSVNFRLFFILPAASIDTSKIVDSLRILYTPIWSKAYVEN